MIINGKKFEILYDRKEISNTIDSTVQTIQNVNEDFVFIVMANGANWFSQKVFEQFPTSLFDIEYALLKSYSGNERNEIEVLNMPKPSLLQGKNVIILEDIIDSGTTMKYMLQWCKEVAMVKTISVCPLAIREGVQPQEYNVINTPIVIPTDKWIVGCGLDFDHYGRNLPDLYFMIK